MPVAAHFGVGGDHLGEGCDGLLCLGLLKENRLHQLCAGNARLQASGGFVPVGDIVALLAVALLVEMEGVVANFLLAGFACNGGRR